MSKQGIIVVSHPRSGSSEFIRILAHFAAKTLSPDKPVGVLAECFHWADPSVFGNLPRLHVLSEKDKLTFPCDETVMEPYDKLPTLYSGDNVVWQENFFRPVVKHFKSRNDIRNYYLDQYQQRIGYVNETITAKSFPILKNFVGFTDFLVNDNGELLQLQETLLSKLTNIEPIFFYRKNLIDSIYSDLIKHLYIDQALINSKENLSGFSGHNLNNTMPPLKPRPGVVIDEGASCYYTEIFCKTLQHYQMNRQFFKNVVSYDQAFVDKKFNLYWGDAVYEVTDHNNQHREYPMNYQAPKRDYFENPDIVIDSAEQVITRHGLWDLVNELGIIVK